MVFGEPARTACATVLAVVGLYRNVVHARKFGGVGLVGGYSHTAWIFGVAVVPLHKVVGIFVERLGLDGNDRTIGVLTRSTHYTRFGVVGHFDLNFECVDSKDGLQRDVALDQRINIEFVSQTVAPAHQMIVQFRLGREVRRFEVVVLTAARYCTHAGIVCARIDGVGVWLEYGGVGGVVRKIELARCTLQIILFPFHKVVASVWHCLYLHFGTVLGFEFMLIHACECVDRRWEQQANNTHVGGLMFRVVRFDDGSQFPHFRFEKCCEHRVARNGECARI